jgi:hypothetical protein
VPRGITPSRLSLSDDEVVGSQGSDGSVVDVATVRDGDEGTEGTELTELTAEIPHHLMPQCSRRTYLS